MSTRQIKMCLVGNSGVGKTCIISRFTTNVFNQNVGSTIGANFVGHDFTIKGRKVHVSIWDTGLFSISSIALTNNIISITRKVPVIGEYVLS